MDVVVRDLLALDVLEEQQARLAAALVGPESGNADALLRSLKDASEQRLVTDSRAALGL